MSKEKKSKIKSPQVRDPDWKLLAVQFPNNLRLITENFVVKFFLRKQILLLTIIASILIILTILVVALDLSNNYIRNQKYIGERESIQKEIRFWESVLQKYPDYRDAYYELAVLNYRLKDIDKSRKNINKALRIDPNFKEGNEFKKYFKN